MLDKPSDADTKGYSSNFDAGFKVIPKQAPPNLLLA